VPWIGATVLILVAAVSAGATLLSRFGRTAAVAVYWRRSLPPRRPGDDLWLAVVGPYIGAALDGVVPAAERARLTLELEGGRR
jgi:hypothetical protein